MTAIIQIVNMKRESRPVLSGKRVVDRLYSIDGDGNNKTFYCTLCTKQLKSNETAGYTKWKKHIEISHSDAYQCYREFGEKGAQLDLTEFKYSKHFGRAYSCVEVIIICPLLLLFLTN